MKADVLKKLTEVTSRQLPSASLFSDGTFYSTMVDAQTWISKGVDEEIAGGAKVLKCKYRLQNRVWKMIAINDAAIEELID